MTQQFNKGRLKVKMSQSREALGKLAASEVADYINELLAVKKEINIIFASAPSQNEFLANLIEHQINWSAINAFHMDEYVGIDSEAPQSFGKFLKDRVFSKIQFKSENYINSMAADLEAECERYAKLLSDNAVDVVFLGIGENGHLAFNDPHVAYFDDEKSVKIVELDAACRNQQVNDGCFSSLEQVPTDAFTVTIPELFHADKLFAIVPAATKAQAIKATLEGPISTQCPASLLRCHKDATLYIDKDSGSLITI